MIISYLCSDYFLFFIIIINTTEKRLKKRPKAPKKKRKRKNKRNEFPSKIGRKGSIAECEIENRVR
jgi:hypothetical protein